MLGGPPEFQDSIKGYFSYYSLPMCGVFRLLWLAQQGHGDYTWGFRIYRTTYNEPDSDARFTKAIETLNEYIRYECFSYVKDERHSGDVIHAPLDGKANEQLWHRMSHEIIEDRELEGAPETPSKILKLAQDWVRSCEARTGDSPRYRFFLVFDDEVINHLLQLPIPVDDKASVPAVYSVKVYDARFNSPSEVSDGGCDSEDDDEDEDDYEDEDEDGFEGWFWTSAALLARLWFCGYQAGDELVTIDHSWDATKRFVHTKAAIDYGLPLLARSK